MKEKKIKEVKKRVTRSACFKCGRKDTCEKSIKDVDGQMCSDFVNYKQYRSVIKSDKIVEECKIGPVQ